MNEGTVPAASDDSAEHPIGSLAGAFPELARLSDADLEWAKKQWQRGVDRQLELVSAESLTDWDRLQAASGYAPFDAADYLDDEETIAEYLAAALENPNPEVLNVAVQDVLRTHMKARDATNSEALATMLATEAVLRRDWDRPEEVSAWTDL
jgi:DNA-binding phage protein